LLIAGKKEDAILDDWTTKGRAKLDAFELILRRRMPGASIEDRVAQE
jgi:hypothetical protein